MRVDLVGLTDTGRVRNNNEDAFVVDESLGLAVVCDGVGGLAKGEVASAMVVETVGRLLQPGFERLLETASPDNPEITPPAAGLIAAVRLANQRVYVNAADAAHRGMSTTIVTMRFTSDGGVVTASAGDSRVYRLRAGMLHQITRDHSYLNELLEDKAITSDEAKTFRQKNVISRALGMGPTVKLDLRIDQIQTGDVYLACSDGLHGAVDDETLAGLLRDNAGDLPVAAQLLVDEANRRGGPDNVTVVLARVADAPVGGETKTVKVELTDSEAELPRRERALRKVFPLPRAKDPRSRLPVLVGGGIAVVLAILAVVLFAPPPKPPVKPTSSHLQVAVMPESLSSTARITLDGREIRPAGEVITCDTQYVLRVEAPGRRLYEASFTAARETTRITAVLQPEALVGIRYNNYHPGEQVVLAVYSGGRKVVNQALTTEDLVADTLRTFPLEQGTYRFTISSEGRVLFDWTATLEVGEIAKIVPDNAGSEFKVVSQEQER